MLRNTFLIGSEWASPKISMKPLITVLAASNRS